jgi:hypothetical protein
METSPVDSPGFLRFWLLLSDREDRDNAEDKADKDMVRFWFASLDGPDTFELSGEWP